MHEIDVSALEPVAVVPPSPRNTQNLADHAGKEVQVGYLGFLRVGPLGDLEIAAEVLRGGASSRAFNCMWCPPAKASWRSVQTRLPHGPDRRRRLCGLAFLRLLLRPRRGDDRRATGRLHRHPERARRMGSPDSEIYIVNAAAVAAAAVTGEITDPRPYLQAEGTP